ncbi:MAG: cell division protein SepF [Candidatus Aenigmarchaeota archaeon]|nr:cell division protein SepF [Candidatus Aenigmarchaeota archaeon]
MFRDLKTMLKGTMEDEGEYTELEMVEETAARHVPIVIEKIENFTCADRIIRHVREGKVVFARIKDIRNVNMDELKRSIAKIKNVTTSIDGDMVGVADEWLIVAPSIAKIAREAV